MATDAGVVRFESGSRRQSQLTMDDGLPSDAVTAVAVDEQFVWFGTNKGLVRYRKLDRTLRLFGEEDNLPHRAVNDLQRVGRAVWIATRGGLAVYDPDSDGLRPYTSADGLGADFVEELYQLGEDLWCRTDAGLSRLQIAAKRFTNFSFADLGGSEIRVFVADGERAWLGTEQSLLTFEPQSDAFIAFPQAGALESRSIRGVEPFSDYVFIATDAEVVQYNKLKSNLRRYTEEADGIPREAGARGTVLSGGQLLLVFDQVAVVYEIVRDVWLERSLAPPAAEEKRTSSLVWLKADAEVPFDLRRGQATDGRFATGAAGFGLGQQYGEGRSLDLSGTLDYGELELEGIRDVELRGEYLGNQTDLVREVTLDDALKVELREEGVEGPFRLLGGHARVASPGEQPTVSATVDGGVRRGLSARDFFTGPRQEVYQLTHRYVLPASERVYLDGELLTAGKEYTVIYPAGQLAFLDPEKVDDLSIIEVAYEYDVVPKKGLGVISLLDLLPADNEVGAWSRSAEPTVISEESGLYAQIDGAAPKYIDRGWRRSVYAEYRQGSRTIQLAIHDMETPAQARDLWDYDLPAAREPVGGRDNVVLDLGLATSYAVKAYQEGFYIELAIDEKSDPARQSIRLFALQVLDRGDTAGAYTIDELNEALVQARAAWSPASGVELGARAIQLSALDEGERRGRRLLTGVLDGRYERGFGQGGRVTAHAEAVATHGQRAGDRDGWASMARLRLSHPWLEGSLEGRYHDRHYVSVGSRDTLQGTLHDEARLSATAYPTRWLPTTVFFSRQGSTVAGEEDLAVVQHALARLQLAHKALPATSVQLGHTLLDDALGSTTQRLKVVGETDYDLAEGLLKPLGLRRFNLRGLYGLSVADTETRGAFARADRVEVSRLEAKLAPTATETAYALFRSRVAHAQEREGEPAELSVRFWELNAGARSAIIPGIIPQLNYAVIYDHDRLTDEPQRTVNGSLSGQLGVFPGQWLESLSPVAVDARYSVGHEARSERGLRTSLRRLHRVDNRMSYVGTERWELELREILELSFVDQTQAQDGQRLELRNRLVYRPTQSSPITLRLDYVDELALNDRVALPEATKWGKQRTYETALEWLKRWSKRWTTRLRTTYTLGETINVVAVDEATGEALRQDYRQHQLKPEVELRFLLQSDNGSLFLVQRDRVYRLFGDGAAASESIGWDVGLGVIWSAADIIYLDAEIAYRQTHCLERDCSPLKMLQPRLLFTARL